MNTFKMFYLKLNVNVNKNFRNISDVYYGSPKAVCIVFEKQTNK